MADIFKIQIDPKTKAVLEFLGKGKLLELKQAMENIGKDYRKHKSRIFSGRELPDTKWPRLKTVTRIFKRQKFGATRILVGSGAMKKSLIREGSTHNVSEVSAKQGEFGTRIPYAQFHRTGLPNRRVKSQKQRFWLGLNLGLWKKVGDPLPLPKRDPITPNKSTVDGWPKIIEKEMRRIGKLFEFEIKET